MVRICILGERPQAIISRLDASGTSVPATSQFPYYLPDEETVVRISRTLSNVASTHENHVELHWVDSPADMTKALQMIGERTVFWSLTDGYWPFVGSSLIGILRGFGGQVFGSGPMASALSQNKYLQYSLFQSLNISTPRTWCYPSEMPEQVVLGRYIAKPIDLGNSIGIFDDGIACSLRDAIAAAERIDYLYGRQAIIQEYIDGAYCRASFVGRRPAGPDIGVHLVLPKDDVDAAEAWTGFDSYFDTYKRRDAASNSSTALLRLEVAVDRRSISRTACDRIVRDLTRLAQNTDLQGLFSIDIIVRDDTPYFIEINTNPFLRNAALQAFCQERLGCNAIDAVYKAIAGYRRVDV